jgi:hypothetical protein
VIRTEAANLRFGPVKLEWAEGHFFEDTRVEELDIGILKDQADATPETVEEGFILEAPLSEAFAEK